MNCVENCGCLCFERAMSDSCECRAMSDSCECTLRSDKKFLVHEHFLDECFRLLREGRFQNPSLLIRIVAVATTKYSIVSNNFTELARAHSSSLFPRPRSLCPANKH